MLNVNSPIILQAILFISSLILVFGYIRLYFKKNKLEGEFTTIVNHVFRTPLTSILWIANELKGNHSYDERQAYAQDIENASDKLLNVVDILLGIKDINNQSSYVFGAVSIREIVEKSLLKHSNLISQKNINLQVSTFEKMPLLTADLKKLSFAVDILIENAVRYTPNNGSVKIDCKVQNNKIVFFVTDNGIGFDIFEKINLFKKFYRSKSAKIAHTDGMGVGLYLAKIIVSRHGGQMYAQSNSANKGATFFIELPLK